MTLPYDPGARASDAKESAQAPFSSQAAWKRRSIRTQYSLLGPFDVAILGEGEEPLVELAAMMRSGGGRGDVPGTAWLSADGRVQRRHRSALDREALKAAIFSVPYEDMPYREYWEAPRAALSSAPVAYQSGAGEFRLAEIRSVRLITLNYCPMGCTFCSSTNFLHAAQGGQTARVARLDEHECLAMLKRIVRVVPDVRTIIFQDDIFVFTKDARILPLCDAIVAAKEAGELPAGLQFISTNRIDAMTTERLAAMRRAGFRVLGFGVESFAPGMCGSSTRPRSCLTSIRCSRRRDGSASRRSWT